MDSVARQDLHHLFGNKNKKGGKTVNTKTTTDVSNTARKFRRKKLDVVYCRQMFQFTGKDIEPMSLLDESYGLHVRRKNRQNRQKEKRLDGVKETMDGNCTRNIASAGTSTDSAARSTSWTDRITGCCSNGSASGNSVSITDRWNISKNLLLAPAHHRYARRIVDQYTAVGELIHDRKKREIEEEIKNEERTHKLKDLFEISSYMKRKRKVDKTEYEKQLATAKSSLEMETEAERGERNLLDFIQRFHGAFFYKKEQLLFEGFQLLYINDVIPTLAPNIVGPVWSIIGPRLCKQFGWGLKNFHDVMVAQAPRRFGKTICIAVIVINYALAKSPCEISIFSTGKRVSSFLQEKIKDILTQSGYSDWIFNIGAEFIYMKDPDNPNDQLRKIGFYPSSTVISILFILTVSLYCVVVASPHVFFFTGTEI